MYLTNFLKTKKDLEFLTIATEQTLFQEKDNEKKALAILTGFAIGTSLYEKAIKDIFGTKKYNIRICNFLKQKSENEFILMAWKYSDHNPFTKTTLDEFKNVALNPKESTKIAINEMTMQNDLKTLSRISYVIFLLRDEKDAHKESSIKKRIRESQLPYANLENLCEQLASYYSTERTNSVHGGYIDLKTAYGTWKDRILPFLSALNLALSIMEIYITEGDD